MLQALSSHMWLVATAQDSAAALCLQLLQHPNLEKANLWKAEMPKTSCPSIGLCLNIYVQGASELTGLPVKDPTAWSA